MSKTARPTEPTQRDLDYFSQALDIGCRLRDLSLRDVRNATGVPLEVLRAYRRGDATPGPADFVRIWEFLSSDPPRRKRP